MGETLIVILAVLAAALGVGYAVGRRASGKSGCGDCGGCGSHVSRRERGNT